MLSSGFAVPPERTTPLLLEDVEGIGLLGQVFEKAGYDETGLRASIGEGGGPHTLQADTPLYLRRLPEGAPLSTLIKLFLLGLPVDLEEANAAFQPLTVERVANMGILQLDSVSAEANVRLTTYDGLWFMGDRFEEGSLNPSMDYVTGVHAASVTLATITVRRPIRTALDLGTGCGVQALLAARHSDQVVATDVSPRAVNFTAFNALLNGFSNVQVRPGNLFEPVADERFDLIVTNPPFVISPESTFIYRDSELPGDEVCRRIIQELPAHLEEGGYASILCNWAQDRSDDWVTPIRGWVEGNGCDAWILHFLSEDPLTYAAGWNEPRPSDFADRLDRWVDYYRQLNIQAVASGAVILRRRSSGENWGRADSLATTGTGACSDQIQRVFASQDLLQELASDEALLGAALRPVAGQRLVQELGYENGEFRVREIRLRMEQGLHLEGILDAHTMVLLTRSDGSPLREVIREVAAATNATVEAVTPAALQIVRRLIGLGFLEPVPANSAR
jgi:methylase of polypeptide subunit release factors